MSSTPNPTDASRLVSLADEEAVKENRRDDRLDLWKVVNNLTRLGRRSASGIASRSSVRRAPSQAPSSTTR